MVTIDKIINLLSTPIKRVKTDLTLALYTAYSSILSEADSELSNIIEQVCLFTSSGFWVDFWGERFDLKRLPKEEDASFISRIQQAVYASSNTVQDIQSRLVPYVASTPTITEYKGDAAINIAYESLNFGELYDRSHMLEISFEPVLMEDNKYIYVSATSYVGVNSFVASSGKASYSLEVVQEIVNKVKMAGVKPVYNNN